MVHELQKGNRFNRLLMLFSIAAILVPLFYSLYTNHVWEDFLITFRHSQNMVEGRGLVYNPGERVHGFTSPLGVLLPALCHLITGKSSYLHALWLFRMISIAAFVMAGILLLLSLGGENKKKFLPGIFLGLLYVFETKSVAFSVNGMETAFMLFFLSGFILCNHLGLTRNWIMAGVSWAGMMWTRPDSFVYIAALSLANLIFNQYPKKETLAVLLKIAGACALLYLPWFLGAWGYYGSPVPNTVLAKLHLKGQMTWFLIYEYTFGPVYPRFGSWPQWIKIFSYFFGIFSSFYWLFPVKKDRLGRMISFALFLMHFYFLAIRTSPWYFPPLAMMSSFILVNGIFTLSAQDTKIRLLNKPVTTMILSLVISGVICIFVLTAIEMHIQQKEVENGNRKAIGLWLREHVKAQEKVYLEPVGYIGYFSQSKMLDYPGLVSPEVVRLLNKRRDLDFYTVIPKIRPDWIVLRYGEAEHISNWGYFKDNYYAAKTFNVLDNLKKYRFIPGIVYVTYDANFLIFRKK